MQADITKSMSDCENPAQNFSHVVNKQVYFPKGGHLLPKVFPRPPPFRVKGLYHYQTSIAFLVLFTACSFRFRYAEYNFPRLREHLRHNRQALKELVRNVLSGKRPSWRCTDLGIGTPRRLNNLKVQFCLAAMGEETVSSKWIQVNEWVSRMASNSSSVKCALLVADGRPEETYWGKLASSASVTQHAGPCPVSRGKLVK